MKMSGFLVDDIDEGIFEAAEEEDDPNDDLFDSVCAFCDNGGEILWYAFLSSLLIKRLVYSRLVP